MKNNTKKKLILTSVLLPLSALGTLTMLSAARGDNTGFNQNADQKNSSSFFGFHNAYDYFNQGNIKNEAYGYGLYDGFSNLSAKYNLDNLNEKPYNDTRTYIGSTKPIDGSAFSSGYNGDSNLMEKGFNAMGIKLASKPENRYEFNSQSFLVNIANQKFQMLAKNILEIIKKMDEEIDNNVQMQKIMSSKEANIEDKFVYDIYLTTKDKIKQISQLKKITGQGIDFGKYKMGIDFSALPTYKAFDFENDTLAWIQSFIYTLKNFNYGGIDNANGTLNGKKVSPSTFTNEMSKKYSDWNSFGGVVKNILWNLSLPGLLTNLISSGISHHSTRAAYDWNTNNSQLIVFNDAFNSPRFNASQNSFLTELNGLLSKTIRSEMNTKEDLSPFAIIVPSQNPIVVDYNPSFKNEIYSYLISLGANSTTDTNLKFSSQEATSVAAAIIDYINKQAGISNVSPDVIFRFNLNTFGSALTNAFNGTNFEIEKFKQSLRQTKLTVPSTTINDAKDLVKQLAESKNVLANNFDNKVKNMSSFELDNLKYSYYNAIDNKISTTSPIFDYVSQLEININNKDDYAKYQALHSKPNRSEEEEKQFKTLQVKFSPNIIKVSLKQYLENIAILNNFYNDDVKQAIEKLPNTASFLDIWNTLQDIYGIKKADQYNNIPTDLFIFEQSIESKIDEQESNLKNLYATIRNKYEKTNSVDQNAETVINGIKNQIANLKNLLNVNEAFQNILNSLDLTNVNIYDKIKEYNVNTLNIENNLNTMLFNSLNGFDVVSKYINNTLLNTMVRKGFSELTALDNGQMAGRYLKSIFKTAGTTLLNVLSLNIGGVINDAKKEAQKNAALDEVQKSKGLTLSAFVKLQSELEFNKMVQRSVYLGYIANKILYLQSLVDGNDFDALRNSDDFKGIYSIFVLGKTTPQELNETNAPDYLIAQSVNGLVKSMRNILEKDNENNALIQGNEFDNDDLSFLGSYVSQAIALNYNYQKALGQEFDSDDLVANSLKDFNNNYFDSTDLLTADAIEKDLANTFKVNIFNVSALKQDFASQQDLFNDFKKRIEVAISSYDDSVINKDYQNSELWSKLANYDANKTFFDNLKNEQGDKLKELVKNAFVKIDNDNLIDLFANATTLYLQNASLLYDLKANPTKYNTFGTSLKDRQTNTYNTINSWFAKHLDVGSVYVDKLSAYLKANNDKLLQESSNGINASDKYLDAFRLKYTNEFNTIYQEDNDYNSAVSEVLNLAYLPNNLLNFGFDANGFNQYDQSISDYLKTSDYNLMENVNKELVKQPANNSVWSKIQSGFDDVSSWWANNMPQNIFSKAFFTYKFAIVPVYSHFKHGHFLYTYQQQLMNKQANKIFKMAKTLGSNVEKGAIKSMLAAGESEKIAELLSVKQSGGKKGIFKSIFNKFKGDYIINNADNIATKGVKNYSKLAKWTESAKITPLKQANPDQLFTFLTRDASGSWSKEFDGLWKSMNKSGKSRLYLYQMVNKDERVAKQLFEKTAAMKNKPKYIAKTLKKLDKIQNAKHLTDVQKAKKATKMLTKLGKSRKLMIALNGRKAYYAYKLAKAGAFFKNAGRLILGAFKTNPVGLILSVALDSVINFLTFDTTVKAGYWLPLNAQELDNIHTENDYDNTSKAIVDHFNDDKLLNPVKIGVDNYISVDYLKEIVSNPSFALSEAKRILGVNDDAKFSEIGTNEYSFLYYFKNNAINQLLNLDTTYQNNNSISSHKFRNTTLYFDNQDQSLNSVKFDFQDKNHNFANYLNRTNIIDLNVDFKEFVNNPFTKYLDFSALNNINSSMFVSDNNGGYGAYGSYVKLPISDLLNTGLTSLVFVGNQNQTSMSSSNDNLKDLLENAPIFKPLSHNISVSTTSTDLNSAEKAQNKTARWYSLIPFVGSLVAEKQRDGSLAFKLDAAPQISALPYLPSNTVYQIINNLNGNGQNRQSLYAYSTITVKLVRMPNGHLGLKVVQGIYDNSSTAYEYNSQSIHLQFTNAFNGALIYNQKELNKDFFKDVINKIQDATNSEKYAQMYMDVDSDLSANSNLDNINLNEIAAKNLVITHSNPEDSANFFVKSYALRLKNDLLKALENASMPKSLISGNVINAQINDNQKELIKSLTISRLDFAPYYDLNNKLQLKIRYDVRFDNASFNKQGSPVVSFFVNNNVYNLNKEQNFFNTLTDISKLKSVSVKENTNSKLKSILNGILKIKEYSSLNQATYNLNKLYEDSIQVDPEQLKTLENQYLELLTTQYNKQIDDLKFNYLKTAFVSDFVSQETLDKEYSQARDRQEVLNRYYDKLLLEDKILLENRINKEVFDILSPEETYNVLYKNNINLVSDEDRMKFLALKLNKIYYQKKVFDDYDSLEAYFSKPDATFNVLLTNPFSFEIFTNKEINLNNGGSITFRDNFNNQSYKQINVKGNKVVFAWDLNNFDNQERIYYNEYTKSKIDNPYQLQFDLVDENGKHQNITINFKLPDLSQSDINFKQDLDNNIKKVYTSKYINLKTLPFAKNINNLTLDDINTLIKDKKLDLTFGDDKDQLALNYLSIDPLLSQSQRNDQIQLFNKQKELNDNDRFVGFIALNPFRVLKTDIEKQNNIIQDTFTLNANQKVNELFYDENNVEYINTKNPFTTVDIAYLFDNNKLLNLDNLVNGTKITYFKTDDGNKPISNIKYINVKNNKAIINFGLDTNEYSGLYKLSFLVPTATVNNQKTYFKFNKLVYLSKNKANEITNIKNEINNYLKEHHSNNYLLDLDDNSYYQSLAPFINKLNKSSSQINGVVFNNLYQDYLYSKNKYLINTLKYKNITQKVKLLLSQINNDLEGQDLFVPKTLDEYISKLSSNKEQNKQLINELKSQLSLNRQQLISLQNEQKNSLAKINIYQDKQAKLISLINKLGQNQSGWKNISYEDISSVVNISKLTFHKLQVKELLYHAALDKSLVLDENTINSLLDFIHNPDAKLLDNFPAKSDTNYYASELINAVNEASVHNDKEDLKLQKQALITYLTNLLAKLQLVKSSYQNAANQFIKENLNEQNAKKSFYLKDTHFETGSKANLDELIKQAKSNSNLKVLIGTITYSFNLKDYVYKKLQYQDLDSLTSSLDSYVVYEKQETTNASSSDGPKTTNTYYIYHLATINANHLLPYVKFNVSNSSLEWLNNKNDNTNLTLTNIDSVKDFNEDNKSNLANNINLNTNALISYINNTLTFDFDKIDTLINHLQLLKNKATNNFNDYDQDPALKNYFALLDQPDTYNKAQNEKKLLLLNAYNILNNQLATNFDTILKQELNKVNDLISINSQIDYEDMIASLQTNIDKLQNKITKLGVDYKLPIQVWMEQILFNNNDILLTAYLKAISNQEFNSNQDYLEFLTSYLKTNNITNPTYQNIIYNLMTIENLILSIFNIDEDVLITKTTDIKAFEYLVNKITPLISNQDGIKMSQLNELLRINHLASDFVFSQDNWKVKGFINQINIDNDKNYIVLQLLAHSDDNLQKQVVMLKLNYDKPVEFYVISDQDDVNNIIDINKGEWKQTLVWQDSLKTNYMELESNPDYVLKTLDLNGHFQIKDKTKLQENKIIKNNVLQNLDLFNSVLTLRDFNSLFSSQVINDLQDFNNIWDIKFNLSVKTIKEDNLQRIDQYTLQNSQYKIVVNVVLLKTKENVSQEDQKLTIYTINNKLQNQVFETKDINALNYELNKNLNLTKNIQNVVNITTNNQGLDLIKPIILKDRNSVILDASQFKTFLDQNNLEFSSSLDVNNFFKNVDLISANGEFKPYIYQISLANNYPNLDIITSNSLGLQLLNLKIEIFDEFKKQFVSKPFIIILEKQHNDYENIITSSPNEVNVQKQNITKNSLTSVMNDIISQVNKDYLYYQSKYLQNDYFTDTRKLNLKSAIFYALNTYAYINPVLNPINNANNNLDLKVDYIYQYLINHYTIPYDINENQNFKLIIQMLMDNYLFSDKQLENDLDQNGKVIKAKPQLELNKVYELSHHQFTKQINYQDISFNLSFVDLNDELKASLLKDDTKLYQDNKEVKNPFNQYYLTYDGSTKYITFKAEEINNQVQIRMITTTQYTDFDLSNLLLDKEKGLDRDITNNLIISRLNSAEKLIQDLIELQKTKLTFDKQSKKISKIENDFNQFEVSLKSTYNKNMEKSILNKDNMFIPNQLINNLTSQEDVAKLINDKQFILSLTHYAPNSYLNLLSDDDYYLRLLEVIKNSDDIISYVYEISFKNPKLENIKLQLNFVNNPFHTENINQGSIHNQEYVSTLEHKETYTPSLDNQRILLASKKINLLNQNSRSNIISPFYNLDLDKDAANSLSNNNSNTNKNPWLPFVIGFSGILTVGIVLLAYVIVKRKRTKTNFKG